MYKCKARGFSYMVVVPLGPTTLTVRSMKSTFESGSVKVQLKPPLFTAFLKAL